MKLKSFGLIVASCVVASVFSGCVAGAQTVEKKPSGKKDVCEWEYDFGIATKKIDPTSLKLTNGADKGCKVEHSKTPLYIGDDPRNVKKVIDIGAVEMITEGSCRYCYINTSGGMSCVIYPC